MEVISLEPFAGAPRIASSSTMCKFLHNLSLYCIALNFIFPANTLSPTFSNFRSSLQQMERTPIQVWNHYSPKNQDPHLTRSLAFKNAANRHVSSNVYLPIISLPASYCGRLISLISLMNDDDDTNPQIADDDSENTGEYTFLSDINEDHLDHQQEVLHLGLMRQEKSLRTTRVPLPQKRGHADTVIACPLHPNCQNLPVAMAPPLLKCQKSSLVNKLFNSDHAPSAWALVHPNMSSGNVNIQQPKASCDQNVPHHQKATFETAKRFMEAIVFTNNHWPILSDDKYLMVEETWKLAIEAQDHRWALAGAPVDTPSVCQLRSGPSLKMDPQMGEPVSPEFCSMLLYPTYRYWLPARLYIVETED